MCCDGREIGATWRVGRVADCGGLENRWSLIGSVGSNPALSAQLLLGPRIRPALVGVVGMLDANMSFPNRLCLFYDIVHKPSRLNFISGI